MVRLETERQKRPVRELFLIKKRVMNGAIKVKFLFFEGLVSLPWLPLPLESKRVYVAVVWGFPSL